MFAVFSLLVLSLTVISAVAAPGAVPPTSNRIVGGSLTTISEYPFAAALLYSKNLVTFSQSCGGTLITTRAILSAAQCSFSNSIYQWCARLGSSYANSGGTVYTFSAIIIHNSFDYFTLNNDIAILLTTYPISLVSGSVQPASIAGANYNLADNQAVWAIGWGATSVNGVVSEPLRHVQIWSVNQEICRSRYNELGWRVTDNMLCSGWLDVGGRDQCQGDSGGPLIHNNVVVGISSWAWGKQCAQPRFPGIYTRVSMFSAWIAANVN